MCSLVLLCFRSYGYSYASIINMRTTYIHTCVQCSTDFESVKRSQLTCSTSCRGKYATSKNTNKRCKCGKMGSVRGRCKDCTLIAKRESRRKFYYTHKEEINQQRKQQWDSQTPKEKLSKSRALKERRFNGHRMERLQKDNYQCQNCGNKEQLIVHHIKHLPPGTTIDTWSTINDLITWCRSCHMKHHKPKL